MALITCPECGAQISDKAPACIHCGFPLTAQAQNECTQQDFYLIELKKFKTWGDDYYSKFLPLLELFPDTYKDYPFKELPHIIGTGLTKES